MAEKVSRDRGYRSDTIAVSRDMGPLSSGDRKPSLKLRSPCFGSFVVFNSHHSDCVKDGFVSEILFSAYSLVLLKDKTKAEIAALFERKIWWIKDKQNPHCAFWGLLISPSHPKFKRL